jgi:hypothetical protein
MTEESADTQRNSSINAGLFARPLPLCVSTAGRGRAGDKYVVGIVECLTNTDPSSPPDYLSTVLAWADQRIAWAVDRRLVVAIGRTGAADVERAGARFTRSG